MKVFRTITVEIPNAPLMIERTFTVEMNDLDSLVENIGALAEEIPGLKIKGFGGVVVRSPAGILAEIGKEANPASLSTALVTKG